MISIIAGASALCMHFYSLHQAVYAGSCLLFIAISTTMVPVCALTMLWYNVQQEAGHNSQVRLPNGVHWEPESCWDNIYDAISDARVLCYVVGKPALLLLTVTGTPYLLLLSNGAWM